MLTKKLSGNKKLKNHFAALNFALVLSLSLLCTCRAGTENLTNSHYSSASISSSPSLSSSSSSSSSSGAAASEKLASSATSFSSSSSSSSSSYQNAGTRTILRIYDECSRTDGGFVPCLKKKAISFIDRISYIDAISVADGIRVIRSPGTDYVTQQRPLVSENELESNLPRSADDRDTKLTNMLIERLSYFFNGHSLQINFPKLSSEEIGRGLEEGRGKMKKMMSMMMMGMAMKMMGMIPIAMGMLYILAGKALIISKIALLLAGIMGLKKLMSGRGGSGGSSGWSSGGGGGGWSAGGGGGGGSGGWDRRSLNDAHNMAYRGYDKQFQFQQQQQQKHQYDEKAPKS